MSQNLSDEMLARKYYYLGRLYEMGMMWFEFDMNESVRYIDMAARLNYPAAIFQKGMTYFHGRGDRGQDYNLAFKYFFLSGTEDGRYMVAKCYENGYGVDMNMTKAIKIYESLSMNGYSYAAMTLGSIYLSGRTGVEKDTPRALDYFLHAGELGNSAGYEALAKCYFFGLGGLEVDKDMADKWLKEWAKIDDTPEDPYFYDELEPKEYDEAMKFFKELAELGDEDAIFVIKAKKNFKPKW